MLRQIIKFILFPSIVVSGINAAQCPRFSEKIYINEEEFSANTESDSFNVHVGNNTWFVTDTIHRDSTGLFTYECNLSKCVDIRNKMEYVKKWRCPYCYRYWEIGKPCDNKECPSKYK